jgi:AP-3 complex subunit delta-1
MSDPIFQKTLQDLIKGIRANKKDPSSFISQCIAEIKIELKNNDNFVKSEAVIYIHQLSIPFIN